jgi:hypothetical protein
MDKTMQFYLQQRKAKHEEIKGQLRAYLRLLFAGEDTEKELITEFIEVWKC